MENEDQILLDQLKSGDYSAYELIFKKYYKALSVKVYFMLEDDMEAEDLVQNLFISIWQNNLFFSVNTSVKAYLLRSVHNRCLTVLRDKKTAERNLCKMALSGVVCQMEKPISITGMVSLQI
jgi:DNA-directed RNA polymerase specialized sigma24 family protein